MDRPLNGGNKQIIVQQLRLIIVRDLTCLSLKIKFRQTINNYFFVKCFNIASNWICYFCINSRFIILYSRSTFTLGLRRTLIEVLEIWNMPRYFQFQNKSKHMFIPKWFFKKFCFVNESFNNYLKYTRWYPEIKKPPTLHKFQII